MERGTRVHPMMLGDRYAVHDWRRYGFAQPMPGGRWVRHGGEAMLIDRDGRIVDVRSGIDWDDDRHDRRGGHHGRFSDNGHGYSYDDEDAFEEHGALDDRRYGDDYDDEYEEEVFYDHRGYGPPPIGGGWTYAPVTVTETITTTVTESGGTVCCETRRHHRPRKVIRSKVVHPPYHSGEKG